MPVLGALGIRDRLSQRLHGRGVIETQIYAEPDPIRRRGRALEVRRRGPRRGPPGGCGAGSEERRGGEEGRSWGAPDPLKKKKDKTQQRCQSQHSNTVRAQRTPAYI